MRADDLRDPETRKLLREGGALAETVRTWRTYLLDAGPRPETDVLAARQGETDAALLRTPDGEMDKALSPSATREVQATARARTLRALTEFLNLLVRTPGTLAKTRTARAYLRERSRALGGKRVVP